MWKCTGRGKETKRLDRQRSIMMVYWLYSICDVVLVWLSENIPSARTKFGPVSSDTWFWSIRFSHYRFLFPKPLVPRAIRKKYTGDRWSGYELARESIKQTLSLAKSDGVQNSSAASPEIQHRTVWRTWLFIAYSDKSFLTCVTWKKVQYYFELWFRFCLRKMLSLGPGLRHQEWSFDPHEHSFLSLYPNAL